MDNFKVEVCGEDNKTLHDVLTILFRRHPISKGFGYLINSDGSMILFWSVDSSDKHVTQFPFLPTQEFIELFIVTWLKSAPITGTQPDIDGDVHSGWRIATNDWGCAEGYASNSMCSISPIWAMYGK
jgi:hypothetical protein